MGLKRVRHDWVTEQEQHRSVLSISCSVVSDSLWPHGLQPTRLSMGFSRQSHRSGWPFCIYKLLRTVMVLIFYPTWNLTSKPATVSWMLVEDTKLLCQGQRTDDNRNRVSASIQVQGTSVLTGQWEEGQVMPIYTVGCVQESNSEFREIGFYVLVSKQAFALE